MFKIQIHSEAKHCSTDQSCTTVLLSRQFFCCQNWQNNNNNNNTLCLKFNTILFYYSFWYKISCHMRLFSYTFMVFTFQTQHDCHSLPLYKHNHIYLFIFLNFFLCKWKGFNKRWLNWPFCGTNHLHTEKRKSSMGLNISNSTKKFSFAQRVQSMPIPLFSEKWVEMNRLTDRTFVLLLKALKPVTDTISACAQETHYYASIWIG